MAEIDRKQLFSVAGKTALVTGASSGLGEQFALDLAKAGANVVVAARRADRLEELVQRIAELAKLDTSVGKAAAVQLDVSADENAIDAAVEKAWSAFSRIDILVNNAGIFRAAPVLETSAQDFRDTIQVNVTGLFFVAQSVAKRMAQDGKGGSIINVSSGIGVTNGKYAGTAAYSASKTAVIALTESLALELGQHKIRVNALAPGVFPSEMTTDIVAAEGLQNFFRTQAPIPRVGDLKNDLYGPLLLLASDAGAYITGSYIKADGGIILMLRSFFG